jgi:putative spermidine/putrescine transport system substrate-binding protein
MGWRDFWDVKKFPGPRSLYRGVFYTIEAALLADGVSPDKLYPLDEERAFASLDRIKPHVSTWWRQGAQTQAILVSREVDICSGFNAEMVHLILQGRPVGISYEQAFFIQAPWFVIKNAPHKKEAMMFINFCNGAKPQAYYSERMFHGPTNPDAWQYMDKGIIELSPMGENLKKCVQINDEYYTENRDRLTEKFEAWLMK